MDLCLYKGGAWLSRLFKFGGTNLELFQTLFIIILLFRLLKQTNQSLCKNIAC